MIFSYLCTSIYAKSRLNRPQRYQQHTHIRKERPISTFSLGTHIVDVSEFIEFILKRIEEHPKLRKLFI